MAVLMTLFFAVFTLTFLSAVCVLLDIIFYGKLTMPNLNIFIYNAVGGATDEAGAATGDELYGVEPLSYYLKNLVLNFNGVALLSAVYPLAYVLRVATGTATKKSHVCLATVFPLLLWLLLLFSRPHKEERFLFPIYHLIAFSAALTLSYAGDALPKGPKGGWPRSAFQSFFVPLVAIAFAVVSFGRTEALSHNYGAPVAIYTNLYVRGG